MTRLTSDKIPKDDLLRIEQFAQPDAIESWYPTDEPDLTVTLARRDRIYIQLGLLLLIEFPWLISSQDYAHDDAIAVALGKTK